MSDISIQWAKSGQSVSDTDADIADSKFISRKLPFNQTELKGRNWAGSGMAVCDRCRLQTRRTTFGLLPFRADRRPWLVKLSADTQKLTRTPARNPMLL